jgi:hypothetical protein
MTHVVNEEPEGRGSSHALQECNATHKAESGRREISIQQEPKCEVAKQQTSSVILGLTFQA